MHLSVLTLSPNSGISRLPLLLAAGQLDAEL